MELVQVRLVVEDFGASFRFYRDVLGFTPQVDDEAGPYGKLTPPGGGAAIALQARADLERSVPLVRGRSAEDAALIVLKVDDLDAVAAELGARGAKWASEPQTQWERLRVAYLRDPEGNLLEFQQWLVTREG